MPLFGDTFCHGPTVWPFCERQPGRYGVIYADPPWRFAP